eukprot:scaffold2858_cov659-Pavlova_lutheri.AAC.11
MQDLRRRAFKRWTGACQPRSFVFVHVLLPSLRSARHRALLPERAPIVWQRVGGREASSSGFFLHRLVRPLIDAPGCARGLVFFRVRLPCPNLSLVRGNTSVPARVPSTAVRPLSWIRCGSLPSFGSGSPTRPPWCLSLANRDDSVGRPKVGYVQLRPSPLGPPRRIGREFDRRSRTARNLQREGVGGGETKVPHHPDEMGTRVVSERTRAKNT